MFPLRDNAPTRHFPVVTVTLIVANVLVWILYQNAGGAGMNAAVIEGAWQPCEVDDSCAQIGDDWPLNLFTSMFMHGDWLHLGGNMLFLWIFGNNIEDSMGRPRFIVFYLLGGLAALLA